MVSCISPIISGCQTKLLHAMFDIGLNMVFNNCMITLDEDKALIESLGGPAKVAELLGFDKDGGTQRVYNWLTRGIPSQVKLEHPDIFLKHLQAA